MPNYRKRKYGANVGPFAGDYERVDSNEILDLKEGDIKYVPDANGYGFKIIKVVNGQVVVFYSSTEKERRKNNGGNVDIF